MQDWKEELVNDDVAARYIAQKGLQIIEDAIVRLLEQNPRGLRNVDIARSLKLEGDKNYLTWEVLQILIREGKVARTGNLYNIS